MSLALVRGDGEILEGDGGLEERLLILRRPAEVERRPLDRLRPQEISERGDMGALDGADDRASPPRLSR